MAPAQELGPRDGGSLVSVPAVRAALPRGHQAGAELARLFRGPRDLWQHARPIRTDGAPRYPFPRGGVVRILFTGVPGVADRPRCEPVPGIAPQVTPPARVNTRVALQVSAGPRKTIPSTCPWPPAPSSPMNAEATFVFHDLPGRDGATCRLV